MNPRRPTQGTRGARPRFTASDTIFYAVLGAATVMLLATIPIAIFVAPIEKRMGNVQKIFYFHVPSAYAMYIGAAVCCLGSIAYLLRPTDVRDAVARAGAEVAVVFGAI